MSKQSEKDIPRRLLAWYGENRRDLPWRRTADPYRIWVAEIMLQQTRVDTVLPYYERFLEKFPDVGALARARPGAVLKAWESLGYYARARHLHEAARVVARRFGGRIPDDFDDLRRLPGVGAYTAGAILSIAFGRRVAAVDGNVLRVIARLFAIKDPVDRGDTRKRIGEIAARLVPAGGPGHYNQALMDLGSAVCTPRNPDCRACPLATICKARRNGSQDSIPAKRKRAAVPRREAAVAIIRNDRGEILFAGRPSRGLLGGLWRFPGGVLKDGEAPAAGLRRLLREELDLGVRPGEELFSVEHGYSHFTVTAHVLSCAVRGPIPASRCGIPLRWAGPRGLSRLAVSRLERKILAALPPTRPARQPIEDGKKTPNRVKEPQALRTREKPMSKDHIPATPAIRVLKDNGVDFVLRPYKYEERGGTEVAARELGVEEHLTVKTLVMEDETKAPFLVLMHGDREVSTKELARILGVKAVKPCDPAAAGRHTGYMVGGTSPFGTKKKLPVYVEETILSLPVIYINGGRKGLLVEMRPADLVRLLKPVPVKVAR